MPLSPDTLTVTYADDTAILTRHKDPTIASLTHQHLLTILQGWFKKWKIKLNYTKSQHITFTLRQDSCPPVFIDNQPIPLTNEIHYLGLTFDRRMTWGPHVKQKCQSKQEIKTFVPNTP